MDFSILLTLIALGAFTLKSRDQSRRITLLGSYLGKHNIEKLMENLTQGYLRALGEADPVRQAQIWNLLRTSETELSEQFSRFAGEFSGVDEAQARVSTLAIALPYADKLLPAATFDLRKALGIHAQGIMNVVHNCQNQPSKDKAFTLMAELFLMQHTCHWFCRSKARASARMMLRHQTAYAQALASVSADTRQAYCSLVRIDPSHS
jgi:hypothetical protein